ncbi:MAG: STAS domain-containing protein [Bacteroidales bacterium]|jgi:anti-anti-sigma factor|nr:STAS domain-containing protein [Bacteroidales bacterium]
MNNLEINMTKRNDEIFLTCNGRLDANRAGYLNDYIDRLVREGHYHISLDLSGIEYLSSAGIRTLVSQYKNLKAVNGHLSIPEMSGNVKQILDMVGISDMLGGERKIVSETEKEEAKLNRLEAYGFIFSRTTLSENGKTDIELYGYPEMIVKSDYKKEDARVVKSGINHFAIGLGAIGTSFDECKNRFGEYILTGKNVAYLPADGSKKPDYMVATGQLIVSLTELYGLHFTGNFSYLIDFDPANLKHSIGLGRLAETLLQMTDYDRMAFVMIAESGGLIGTSLNASPVDGKKIFSFPEIKESVNFTTEPAHNKMLTLSVGFVFNDSNSDEERFLRPLLPGKSLKGHVHSSVFPYIPLKKTDIDLNETIEYLFNNSEIADILHLTNDIREITGQGESQFIKGLCWVVPVNS